MSISIDIVLAAAARNGSYRIRLTLNSSTHKIGSFLVSQKIRTYTCTRKPCKLHTNTSEMCTKIKNSVVKELILSIAFYVSIFIVLYMLALKSEEAEEDVKSVMWSFVYTSFRLYKIYFSSQLKYSLSVEILQLKIF